MQTIQSGKKINNLASTFRKLGKRDIFPKLFGCSQQLDSRIFFASLALKSKTIVYRSFVTYGTRFFLSFLLHLYIAQLRQKGSRQSCITLLYVTTYNCYFNKINSFAPAHLIISDIFTPFLTWLNRRRLRIIKLHHFTVYLCPRPKRSAGGI